MKIRITDITEDDVVSASAELDEQGYKYDEDYTTLYGAKWAIVGLEFTNPRAAVMFLAQEAVL